MLNLSVIVPVYNEEASLFENISLLESTLGKAGRIKSYQIIIVDDGSRDRSFQIAKTLAENNVNINIIGHEKNSGIGKAGNAGLGCAKYDIVAFIPADTVVDAYDLNNILESIISSDVVVCQRESRTTETFCRRASSSFYRTLIKLLFKVSIEDFSWIYVCRKNIFDRFKIESRSGFAAPEILIKSLLEGLRVSSVFMRYYPRKKGSSKSINLRSLIQLFLDILRLRFRKYA